MRRTSILVACLLLMLTGCGSDSAAGDDEAMIDRNLSQSHTMDDVDWPNPDQSAVEISPVEEVRIELPEGRTFDSDGDTVHDITLDRREQRSSGSRERPHSSAQRTASSWASAALRGWESICTLRTMRPD